MSAAVVARAVGGCLAAGLVVGIVVAGLGSRLVMRLLAVADPDASGTFTENGNVVGEITFGGTLALLVFVGIPLGLAAGLLVFAVRRWLPPGQPWRSLAFSAVLLAVLGRTVIDPDNIDFRLLTPTGLAVALFGLLFLVAGFGLPPLAERWGPGVPRFLYRQDVTFVGGAALAAVVALGLVQVGRDIAEMV
ncbi:MAG TPA: hypothetical protein VD695_02510 [Gaiellaceae bacterium]|nr:hypothetical protein [Gaiellaceae bacterium]